MFRKQKIWIVILALFMFLVGCQTNKSVVSINEWGLEDVSKCIDETAELMVEMIPEPTVDSVGGEWTVMGLARSGRNVSEDYFSSYYSRLEEILKESDGILHKRKYTEYSRVVLALTSIGMDPTDVAGYNLLKPLGDFENVIFQGINGPTFALLALDSGNYEIPDNPDAKVQATREMYIDEILSREIVDGGFTLGTDSDEINIDITAMVLQALAKYQDREDVAEVTERALDRLSREQNENGGYIAFDTESSEAIVQVIMALTELGIDLQDDRFVKNGNSLLDRLMDFYVEGGGFMHVLPQSNNNGGGGAGELDLMATDQGFYGLVGLERVLKGESSYYRMVQ